MKAGIGLAVGCVLGVGLLGVLGFAGCAMLMSDCAKQAAPSVSATSVDELKPPKPSDDIAKFKDYAQFKTGKLPIQDLSGTGTTTCDPITLSGGNQMIVWAFDDPTQQGAITVRDATQQVVASGFATPSKPGLASFSFLVNGGAYYVTISAPGGWRYLWYGQ